MSIMRGEFFVPKPKNVPHLNGTYYVTPAIKLTYKTATHKVTLIINISFFVQKHFVNNLAKVIHAYLHPQPSKCYKENFQLGLHIVECYNL